MRSRRIFILGLGLSAITATSHAQMNVDAAQFLSPEYMQSEHHRVMPQASSDGVMLTYHIETPYETFSIVGTEQAKTRIREIHATEILRQRSTGGAILGSAKDRTTNLVETPYRLGKGLVNRAGDISNVEDAVLFIPEQVGEVAGNLLSGVGELGVTALRITKGAAGTKCSGFGCAKKAGSDIWSGVNSLAGKHNASRRLHAEFGTDPQTDNKAYRKQIDRLAYANAYTGTTVKLGMGQAGIDYISPAFTGVGYINNGEFVGGYEDAHRRKNFEKEALKHWGANPQAIENFYSNTAYTKALRRRMFTALDALPDKAFAVRLFHDSADLPQRYDAESHITIYEYISELAASGEAVSFVSQTANPFIISRDGTAIWPVYADYLTYSPQLMTGLEALSRSHPKSALHVLGRTSPDVKQKARRMGVLIVEWPGRGRTL